MAKHDFVVTGGRGWGMGMIVCPQDELEGVHNLHVMNLRFVGYEGDGDSVKRWELIANLSHSPQVHEKGLTGGSNRWVPSDTCRTTWVILGAGIFWKPRYHEKTNSTLSCISVKLSKYYMEISL
jgi:hypothetical protein